MGWFFAAGPPQGKKRPLGGQQAGVSLRSVGGLFCRRAVPRQKAPPWGMSPDTEQSLRTALCLANPRSGLGNQRQEFCAYLCKLGGVDPPLLADFGIDPVDAFDLIREDGQLLSGSDGDLEGISLDMCRD